MNQYHPTTSQELDDNAPGVIDLQLLTRQIAQNLWLVMLFGVLFALFAFLLAIKEGAHEVQGTISVEPPAVGLSLIATQDIDVEVGRINSWSTVERVITELPYLGLVTKKNVVGEPDFFAKVTTFLKTGRKSELGQPIPIVIEKLQFPDRYIGELLTLEITESQRYAVKDEMGNLLVSGVPSASTPSGGDEVIFHVSAINAPVGSEFIIEPLSKEDMIERILKNLSILKRTNNRSASILDFEFTWLDPAFAVAFIKALMRDYMDNALSRLNDTKQKALVDLETDLSKLRVTLNQKETELSDYMSQLEVADVEAEMRGQLELRLMLEEALRDVQLKKAQMKQIYTKSHPAMKAAREKEARLHSRLGRVSDRLAELPEIKGKLFGLERMVEQQSREYAVLQKQLATLKLEASTVVSPANVINIPRIVRPNLKNKVIQLIVLGGLMGMIIAFCVIVMRINLRANSLENPQQLGSYPALSMNDGRGDNKDYAIDEVVSQLSYLSLRKKGSLAVITSPEKSEAGAIMTLDIARAYADKEGKVLVIDANLKDSHLAQRAGYSQHQGLSNIMAGNTVSEDLIRTVNHSKLYYMPPGSPSMSMMILHDFERLDYLIDEMSKLFDCIIIDLPSRKDLPFWENLLHKSSLAIHLMPLQGAVNNIRDYLDHVNFLAKEGSQTLHEILLFKPDTKQK
jgi:tyrosine-protein kinase Etk/Wzc